MKLNKVEAGGRTAFHRLGLTSRPEARSALFWFNHYRNGSMIDNMFHGGCPVILGHKWSNCLDNKHDTYPFKCIILSVTNNVVFCLQLQQNGFLDMGT